jgi:hypothetical protein
LLSENPLIRQTDVNAAGLFDDHHRVRNAMIGSIKKMGEKNPVPVLD